MLSTFVRLLKQAIFRYIGMNSWICRDWGTVIDAQQVPCPAEPGQGKGI